MFDTFLEKIRDQKLVVLLLCLMLTMGGVWYLTYPKQTENTEELSLVKEIESDELSIDARSEEEETSQITQLTVDIKGAVKVEGVYELPAGSRVTDAIQKAGGLVDDADRKSINLAAKLQDEAVIYVAHQGEETESSQFSLAGQDVQGATTKDGKINLNTATVQDLQTISGIGEKRAQDIIAYRDANGGFKTVDDLDNVSGIGSKTLENIRGQVRVD